MAAHRLEVVAPWYRTHPARARKGTAPVLQKYESSDLVNAFLANPQHSLVFNAIDRVDPVLGPRKLFLDSHKRFYLVVCEIHCDLPGFPNANPADVCQAGFVVRRKRTELTPELKKAAEPKLKQLAVAAAKVARHQAVTPEVMAEAAMCRPGALMTHALARSTGEQRLEADLELNAAKQALREWSSATAVRQVVEGWRASPNLKKIGAWLPLADQTPDSVEHEMSFPLYPLVPDPSDSRHAGHKRAIYFGLIPTGAAETDRHGHPRLDDKSLYEIRCFVRRHKPECPRSFVAPDCHGPLFWSEPTEVFQLATPFDLDGTSNNPVNIPHPKLADLRARLGKPRFQPVRIIGAPEIDAKGFPPKGKMSDSDQICTFAIPLIFIVAYFIFSLFLPILLFLLNLYFLLALKLCIPPTIDVGLAASLDLDVTPASLGFAAGATFAAPGIDFNTHANAKAFFDGLKATLVLHYGEEMATKLMEDFKTIQSVYELVRDRYQAEKETVAQLGHPAGPPPPVDPDKIDSGTPLTADLEFYADLRPA